MTTTTIIPEFMDVWQGEQSAPGLDRPFNGPGPSIPTFGPLRLTKADAPQAAIAAAKKLDQMAEAHNDTRLAADEAALAAMAAYEAARREEYEQEQQLRALALDPSLEFPEPKTAEYVLEYERHATFARARRDRCFELRGEWLALYPEARPALDAVVAKDQAVDEELRAAVAELQQAIDRKAEIAARAEFSERCSPQVIEFTQIADKNAQPRTQYIAPSMLEVLPRVPREVEEALAVISRHVDPPAEVESPTFGVPTSLGGSGKHDIEVTELTG